MPQKEQIVQGYALHSGKHPDECYIFYDRIYKLETTCLIEGKKLVEYALKLLKNGQFDFEKIAVFMSKYCGHTTIEAIDFDTYYGRHYNE